MPTVKENANSNLLAETNLSVNVNKKNCVKFKLVRKQEGITQVELADKLGVSQSLMSKVENGFAEIYIPVDEYKKLFKGDKNGKGENEPR